MEKAVYLWLCYLNTLQLPESFNQEIPSLLKCLDHGRNCFTTCKAHPQCCNSCLLWNAAGSWCGLQSNHITSVCDYYFECPLTDAAKDKYVLKFSLHEQQRHFDPQHLTTFHLSYQATVCNDMEITTVERIFTWLWIFPHGATKCVGPARYPSRQPVIAKVYKVQFLDISSRYFKSFFFM